jgi:sec-independent protein translocase protein TatC
VVPDAPGDDWDVVEIPGADEASTGSAGENSGSAGENSGSASENTGSASEKTGSAGEVSTSSTSENTGSTRDSTADDGRFGESVVRDLLGATLIKEERTGPIDTVDTADAIDTGAQQLPDVSAE